MNGDVPRFSMKPAIPPDRPDDDSEPAALLAGLVAGVEDLRGAVEYLINSGEFTPELEARIGPAIDRAEELVTTLREAVDPTRAPLLKLKRLAKERAREWIGLGVDVVQVRAGLHKVAESSAPDFPDHERGLIAPLLMAALDEVLADPQTAERP